MTERSNCWSLTIFDETYSTAQLPAGWELKGQKEMCPKTLKEHFQGMLTTPQCRFAAVKKVFPLAHIEKARKPTALAQYVKKEDTRLVSIPDRKSNIPTLWDYSEHVAREWDAMAFGEFRQNFYDTATEQEIVKTTDDDLALRYVDSIIDRHIRNGMFGVEFIGINPMFRASWKKFWRAMVDRAWDKMAQDLEENMPSIVYNDEGPVQETSCTQSSQAEESSESSQREQSETS